MCFIGRAWPNFPSFLSTFQINPNKNHPQVWALCRYAVYITHRWSGFPSSIARQQRRCHYRTLRLRKAVDEVFPTPTFLAPAVFLLWRYRPWIIGPGWCDIQRRIRYTIVCGCMSGRFYWLQHAVVHDDVGCVGRRSRESLSFASCEARHFVFNHLDCSSTGYPSKLLYK